MRMRSTLIVCGMAAAFAVVCGVAGAQEQGEGRPERGGRGGEGRGVAGRMFDPEVAANAHELQAKHVAKSLELTDEQGQKLVQEYKNARKGLADAYSQQMQQMTPGQRPDREAMAKVSQEARDKLKTAVGAFLNEEQTGKAMEKLGAFSWRWDQMVLTLADMGLEDEAMSKAMGMVADYAAQQHKAMTEARSSDMAGMREKLRAMNEKLDADLATVLDEEQMAKWKEATETRGPGRSGRQGGAGAPEGGQAPPPPPAQQ